MNSTPKARAVLGIRLPDEMREWLRKKAVENSRSLSQEVLHRLRLSRQREEQSTVHH